MWGAPEDLQDLIQGGLPEGVAGRGHGPPQLRVHVR